MINAGYPSLIVTRHTSMFVSNWHKAVRKRAHISKFSPQRKWGNIRLDLLDANLGIGPGPLVGANAF